jgi:hypothetical protein
VEGEGDWEGDGVIGPIVICGLCMISGYGVGGVTGHGTVLRYKAKGGFLWYQALY